MPDRAAIATAGMASGCRIAGKEKTGSALLLPSCAAGFTGGSRKAGPPYISRVLVVADISRPTTGTSAAYLLLLGSLLGLLLGSLLRFLLRRHG